MSEWKSTAVKCLE